VRGELTSKLFFDYYMPRLKEGQLPASSGWFATPARKCPAPELGEEDYGWRQGVNHRRKERIDGPTNRGASAARA
jgi:hypothetical protein